MDISIDQIKSLRDRTGVSMTDCKKALVEANGDEEAAIELLRKKGAAKAKERSDRETANGAVAFAGKGSKVAMVALGCETDFVAKTDSFLKAAETLAQTLLDQGEDADISAQINDLNIQMGEKVELVSKKVMEAPKVATYLHSNKRIGVMVGLTAGEDSLGSDIAMHIAAMKPQQTRPEEVSEELLEKEKVIWTEQLKSEGKPAEIIEKIMGGKEKKFREENALLTQPFVKNQEQTVGSLLSGAEIVGFARFEV